jgi:hypothetical protein
LVFDYLTVGASGEVCVDFDDGSWAVLKKPTERARMVLQPGRQLLKRRKGVEHSP